MDVGSATGTDGKGTIEIDAPSTGGDDSKQVSYKLTATQQPTGGPLYTSFASAQVMLARRALPRLVTFSARRKGGEGKEGEEQLKDLAVPYDTDVVFSYEVENSDEVVLGSEKGEVGRYQEAKREVIVRPPKGTTKYALTARNDTGDAVRSIWINVGTGRFIDITPEMGLWKSPETHILKAKAIEITANTSLKLTGTIEVIDPEQHHSDEEFVQQLFGVLRENVEEVRDFLDLSSGDLTIEYEGMSPELTPGLEAEKGSFEAKLNFTSKITRGKFEAQAQVQLILFAVEKEFQLGRAVSPHAEVKVLTAAVEVSKVIKLAPEQVVLPGCVVKEFGLKGAVIFEFKPNYAFLLERLGLHVAEGAGAEVALLAAPVAATAVMWLTLGYELQIISETSNLKPTSYDVADGLWKAYWSAIREPKNPFQADSEAEKEAHALGNKRLGEFRAALRKGFPGWSDADFEAAAADALPDIFDEHQAELKREMLQKVFYPQARVLVWKNYIQQHGHPMLHEPSQIRWKAWGALFGDFPTTKGDPLCKVFHFAEEPGEANPMNVPYE